MESFFISNARKSAAEQFFNDSVGIRSIVARAIARDRINSLELSRYDYPEFKLNLNEHSKHDNKHTAVKDKGCGCMLCSARSNVANANRNINWLKKCYFDDDGYYYHYFDSLYVREYSSGPISHEQFYNSKLSELVAIYNNAHNKFNQVKSELIKLNLIDSKSNIIYKANW